MDIPKYVFYDSPLIPSTTRFQHTVDRSSHAAELTAIEIHTTTPLPPLDRLLEELGSLRISIGGTLVNNIPIPLLCALNTPTYTGNRLTIPCDFRMFIGRLLLFDPQPVIISLETLTTTHVSSVRFMLCRTRCDTTERHLLAYGDHTHTIQQVQTQSLQAHDPVQHFTFTPSMVQFTKGFFIEGTLQDISSVRLTMLDRPSGELWMYYAGELSVIARPVTDRYLFVPFNHLADMRSTASDSYLGSFAYRGPIELTVTYNKSRGRTTVHSLVSNTLKYRAGVLQHERGSQWFRLVKALNPERSMCPITYETITGDYCECDTCHYAFDSTALQSYVTGRSEPTCPTCRSPWVNQTVYQQPSA
jgi:hypothetical protein